MHIKALYDEYKTRSKCHPKKKKYFRCLCQCYTIWEGSTQQREIIDLITFHLTKDMVPITTVTKEGLIRSLDKWYVLPSRTYFSEVAIPELDKKCKAQVKTELSQAATRVLWSSRTTEPYRSLTVHFINEDFQLKSCKQWWMGLRKEEGYRLTGW